MQSSSCGVSSQRPAPPGQGALTAGPAAAIEGPVSLTHGVRLGRRGAGRVPGLPRLQRPGLPGARTSRVARSPARPGSQETSAGPCTCSQGLGKPAWLRLSATSPISGSLEVAPRGRPDLPGAGLPHYSFLGHQHPPQTHILPRGLPSVGQSRRTDFISRATVSETGRLHRLNGDTRHSYWFVRGHHR